ncbi:MAG: hypothetical protein J1F60_02945 [Oscillospiraceae bacterium]|nr:hypothetical protein [Oscillospiraceae bacterium]
MEKQEKARKKRGRAARAELYVPQAGGGYRYIGKYYAFSQGQRLDAKRYLLFRTGLSVLSLLLVLGSGLLNSPGMHNTFYVIIPFVGSFLCAVACVWAGGRAMYYGASLKEYVYGATIVRLKGLTVFQAVLSFLAAAGEAALFFLSAEEERKLLLMLAFSGLQLLAAAASLVSRRLGSLYKWEKSGT